MHQPNRREFLQKSSLVAAAILTGDLLQLKKELPLLSFSSLGCPDWTFLQIMEFARQHGYKGIEVRGVQRELDLLKCKEFNSPQSCADTVRQMEDRGLQFVDLGSSANMHISDPTERQKNMDEGKRFITLAQQIKCPFIRVFPNSFPKDKDKQQTMELMVKGLLELGEFARGTDVSVLVESHGDLVHIDDLSKVLEDAKHDHVGLVWDITGMWMPTRESPANAYAKLKEYVRHTHIKDAKMTDGKVQYKLLGQGEVPIFEAIDLLIKDGYKGFYSFEWEKLWHPEIEEPEIALADYPAVMRKHLQF